MKRPEPRIEVQSRPGLCSHGKKAANERFRKKDGTWGDWGITHKIGVMRIPGLGSAEEWERCSDAYETTDGRVMPTAS